MKYMKAYLTILIALCCIPQHSICQKYQSTKVDAPFPMENIKTYLFPQKDFVITKYGAMKGGVVDNTTAIAKAIAACNKAGGGRVVIPFGEWFTGPIHLKSNVNLHLEEGAVLRFSDNPKAYLPAVPTSWEGMECFNYSPLIYAYECENIAITGKGVLQPHMDLWRQWFARPPAHLDALKELYMKASTNVPVDQRQMAIGENHLRPQLIQFNRCNTVLLEGFSIRESPFWTIHLYLCNGGIVRNLNVEANGHNNDGIDLEMSSNFLVENCTFKQGDDAVVIKAGRNQDAWRLNTPCENIVIRNCTILKGHTLLGIGSEISGGIRNIYMHHCTAPKSVTQLLLIKTNPRRGGYIKNIYMDSIVGKNANRVFEIATDVLYQWKNLVPTYEVKITKISDIYLNNISCDSVQAIYELMGDSTLPIQNVSIKNIQVSHVSDFINKLYNVDGIECKNIQYTTYK